MSAKEEFKIIIAGGGLAGLTLANMLEKFDIEYVLLEAYHDIAPQVGASIGLFPNGLRIMDQIGCYESIRKVSWNYLEISHSRDRNGKSFLATVDLPGHFEKRHGYPMMFFDRQWLLQLLYDRLRHKDRVLLNKRVSKIDHVDAGVEVATKDGDRISGTLVIGADGIHSAVREEMFRIGHQLQPGYFAPDETDRVPCYYQCSFGIAQNVPGWVSGEVHFVNGRGKSQFVISGLENRVYWFLFVRLPEAKYGKDIPNYTNEDEVQFAKMHADLPVTEELTFGQVFAKRLSSTLTPLHEVVFKKWFFKRIMILGDSAHKPDPIGGQGGNGAMESAAEFTNALVKKRDERPRGLSGLNDRDIQDIFAQTQAARQARAETVLRLSHESQAQFSYTNPITAAITWGLVATLVNGNVPIDRIAWAFTGGARLKNLPMPNRPRAIPYTDELPAKPVGGVASMLTRLVFAAGMGLLLWSTVETWRLTPFGLGGCWGDVGFINSTGYSLKAFLTESMPILSDPILGQGAVSWAYVAYLLSQLLSPLLIYTIEGYRTGTEAKILSLPSLFTIGIQRIGIHRIAPLYALVGVFEAHEYPTTGRFVRPEVAKALLPALTLAFALPTALMAASTWNTSIRRDWVLIWNAAPLLFAILTSILSAGVRRWQRWRKPEVEGHKPHLERYTNSDVPILKSVYRFAIAVQATAHIAVLWYLWSRSGSSMTDTLLAFTQSLTSDGNLAEVASRLASLSKHDTIVALGAVVASNLYSVWDLRQRGYINTYDAIQAVLGVLGGQVVLGPGATWAGLWLWREGVLAGFIKK